MCLQVDTVFVQSIRSLCTAKNGHYTRFRGTLMPIYTLPVFIGGHSRIWGLSGVITDLVLKLLVPEIYKSSLSIW